MFTFFRNRKPSRPSQSDSTSPVIESPKKGLSAYKDREKWRVLEHQFQIEMQSNPIFEQALRHRSARDTIILDQHETYERIEFLGDAVLGLVVADKLYQKYPHVDEGYLTKLRSKIVKKSTLALLSEKTGIAEAIEIGERSHGKGIESSQSVRADMFESFLGALYLTYGFQKTSKILNDIIDKYLDLEQMSNKVDNYKSMLLEYCQMKKISSPEYRVTKESGPGHNKMFDIQVALEGESYGFGSGSNKKQAEQRAAREALIKLGHLSV